MEDPRENAPSEDKDRRDDEELVQDLEPSEAEEDDVRGGLAKKVNWQ